MRLRFLAALLFLVACERESGFLEKVADPIKSLSPVVTAAPTPIPTPTPVPTPTPQKYSKNQQFKLASTTTTIPAVDILWIIDNSGSMEPAQTNVINNTNRFMSTFATQSQLKWKMGLISTDVIQLPFLGIGTPTAPLLDYQTPNPVPLFQQAVAQLGTGGSNIEQTFTPVLNTLRNYPNFRTPGAYLALIIVTDEEEQSTGLSATSFVNQLTTLVGGDKSKIVVYGVYATLSECGGGFPYTFSRYWDLMNQVTSKKYSLCDPQFGQLLSNIGEDLITKISVVDPVLLLEARPIPSTIRLTYKGQLLKAGFKEEGGVWIYDPIYNVIRITNLAVLDSNIRDIKVEFDIDPKTN